MAKKMRVRKPDDKKITEKAKEFARHRWYERKSEEAKNEVKPGLLALMQDEKVTTRKVALEDEGVEATVQMKRRETMTIDPERLKKALGAPTFNKLTTPQLDESKVEAAIQLGEIDPNVVASCTTETSTPYLEARFKALKKKDD